jgi:adenine-specific DNA-methyltransferase
MSLEKITRGDEQTKSLDLVNDNINKLRELFPEIVTEGKIDFKVLQEILGEELEEGEEYYRFTWAGKAQARREAHKPSTGTLRPCKEESVDWDGTQNLYIEGDNLEVLKLLQKSYANKVKMIYIDPPYNTGKDFVYKDNYKDNLKNYQQVTGQVDNEGNKLSTNSDSDGRYHSNWLNMMYPRLRLARNLLKEDGVIFISLNDVENSNLRSVANEIFGEENFIGELIWETATDNNATQIAKEHEYILTYARNKSNQPKWQIKSDKIGLILNKHKEIKAENNELSIIQTKLRAWINTIKKSNEIDLSGVSHYNYVDEKGVFYPGNPANTKPGGYDFDIIHPVTNLVCAKPDNGYRWPSSTFWEADKCGDVLWGEDDSVIPKIKKRADTATELLKSYYYEDNRISTNYLTGLFGQKVFDNPKSVNLVKKLIDFTTDEKDIVLDFFGGSSTTADSVFRVNINDKKLKFILVQLPELIDEKNARDKNHKAQIVKTIKFLKSINKSPYITEIGKERIRRAGKKIAEENPDKAKELDLGFKVFKLDSSNIKGWDGNPEDLETSLFDAQENIKTDRTEEDVLFEILLKYGLDLTLPIDEKLMDGKKVFSVGFGALFICLADGITNKIAEGIGAWKQELNPATCRVIFKDSGFSDVEKANAVQTLKRFGISEIKSI